MNILAPGKWTINEQGELEPDDDKAQKWNEKGRTAPEEGQTYFCLYERTD